MQPIFSKVKRRVRWYKDRFRVNNPIVGRAVELFGNKVRIDGLTYSVATPQITRAHKSTLAFGLHEMEERELIRRWLPSDIPVLEFGGGLGVVSCLTNRKLAQPTQHVVVEANPRIIPILKRNRDLNKCKFRVLNNAIAYGCDHIDLNLDTEFVGSSVKGQSNNTVAVKTTNIVTLMNENAFDRAGVICDIEGSELDVIQREFSQLGERLRFIMAEMHPAILGAATVERLLHTLVELGFKKDDQIGDSVFFSRRT